MPTFAIPHLGLRQQPPFRLGLALSGGGSRGFAHLGALLALEHAGLRPDLIAGVSAGSVAAVLYAAGMRPMQIVEAFKGSSFLSFTGIAGNRGGLFKLDKFRAFLRRHTGVKLLEELKIPTVVCATDFDHGTPEAFSHGMIDECVAASCCIPIVFRPITIGGTRYVDGGLLHNLPAWAIRHRCRYLIGINVSPLPAPDTRDSFISTAMRTYKLVAHSNASADTGLCDLLIETREISEVGVFELNEIDRTVRAGYDAALAALTEAGFPPLQPGDAPPKL